MSGSQAWCSFAAFALFALCWWLGGIRTEMHGKEASDERLGNRLYWREAKFLLQRTVAPNGCSREQDLIANGVNSAKPDWSDVERPGWRYNNGYWAVGSWRKGRMMGAVGNAWSVLFVGVSRRRWRMQVAYHTCIPSNNSSITMIMVHKSSPSTALACTRIILGSTCNRKSCPITLQR